MQDIQSLPFYMDWKFWSFFVSGCALVCSQIPPLKHLFRGAKLDVEIYQRLIIAHKIGDPQVYLHLIVTNTGGRELTVKELSLRLTRAPNWNLTLKGNTYLPDPNAKQELLLTGFKLKPGDHWAHIVHFYNAATRSEQRNYRQHESALRQDIQAKLAAREDNNGPLVVGDAANVKPFLDLFQQKFCWVHGEYQITLDVQANSNSSALSKTFRITLFESDEQDLRDFAKEYQFGFGVMLPERKDQVVIPINDIVD